MVKDIFQGTIHMARVPITIMGFKCDKCGHEWLPRYEGQVPPKCPNCRSIYWDIPVRKKPMDFTEFKQRVKSILDHNESPLTWTEIRTKAQLPQKLPNNQWVLRLEKEIGLVRERDKKGIILWSLNDCD